MDIAAKQRYVERLTALIAEGQRLYNAFNCVGCHAHGGGAIGPALMDDLWIHGSDPCTANQHVPFQVHAYNDDTFILRENKCINYEGPFIYLLFGQDKVFMQDTGAAPAANSGIAFPVRETVQKIVEDWAKKHGKDRMNNLKPR